MSGCSALLGFAGGVVWIVLGFVFYVWHTLLAGEAEGSAARPLYVALIGATLLFAMPFVRARGASVSLRVAAAVAFLVWLVLVPFESRGL